MTSAGKKEGDLEHDLKTFDKRVERPFKPSRLCWRSPQRPATNPPVCLRQRSSHCFRSRETPV